MNGEQGAQTLPVSKNISDVLGAIQNQVSAAKEQYNNLTEVQKQQIGEKIMADIMTPTVPMILGGGSGGGDGLFGGGAGGGGLIGGLILGSLLRQGNGGLFGGDGNNGGGAAVAALSTENAIAAQSALTNARFDAQSQAAILAAIATGNAALGVEIAKGQGETNTQSALNAAALGVQIQKTSGEVAVQVEKTAAAGALAVALGQSQILAQGANAAASQTQQLAQTKYDLATAIVADGAQTRALIIAQNDAELNRRLVIAANEITELRGDRRLVETTRGVEVNTTNNINMMQQQQQQQAQYSQLANLIWSLGQSIQNNNAAINVGSGTQTSTPTNTNTNIR
jgi:hypothetical protein